MAVVEISVVPLGTGDTSLSKYVSGCLEFLKNKGGNVKFELTPMGTIIEGELPEILNLVSEMHQLPFSRGAKRVLTNIRIDDRRDKELTMGGKLESVYSKLSNT